ncbi:MAG: energy-coupling factor ABC transporter permease [Akkermansia sp.]
MSDALISPTTGATMWIISALCIAYASKKVKEESTDKLVPLMGILGAFIFAAQMINFSIPMTGSSGHLGGGIILAVLLGPWAGLIAMASILAIQALFFADGGLLAYGCNLFNMGFIPCFIAYPFIYKFFNNDNSSPSRQRILWGSFSASIIGLQLGAFAVVLETYFSGISDLPLDRFAMLMQPIHLAIGVVEGMATAALILFIYRMQPSLLQSPQGDLTTLVSSTKNTTATNSNSSRVVLAILAILSLATGGILSWYASDNPDGLEWSTARTAQKEELQTPSAPIYQSMDHLQKQTALLPDYTLKTGTHTDTQTKVATSLSGILGATSVLLLIMTLAWLLRKKRPVSKIST